MTATDKTNILIVDDRPENLVALDAVLDRPDRDIVRASSGQQALALMLDHEFAVVLLDVQMPEMNGFEAAGLMRGNRRTRGVPIIFVTAINKDQAFVFRGYEAGAVDYLSKPLDPVILESKVQVFCDLYRQRRVIERQVEERPPPDQRRPRPTRSAPARNSRNGADSCNSVWTKSRRSGGCSRCARGAGRSGTTKDSGSRSKPTSARAWMRI